MQAIRKAVTPEQIKLYIDSDKKGPARPAEEKPVIIQPVLPAGKPASDPKAGGLHEAAVEVLSPAPETKPTPVPAKAVESKPTPIPVPAADTKPAPVPAPADSKPAPIPAPADSKPAPATR